MRLCRASCDARSSSLSTGICCSRAMGLLSSVAPQHRIELAKEARRVRVPAPPEVLGQGAEPLVRGRDELPQGACFGDDRRQLRARHRQQAHVFGAEDPRVDRLDDEHALQQPAFDDRHAEERAVRILARFRKVLEPGMRRRVGDELRTQALGDQARQAFSQAHADAADAFGAESNRRREHQIGAIGLQKVDRADVGLEPPLDQMDDVVERFRGVPAGGHEPADFFQRPERRVFVARHHVPDAHLTSELNDCRALAPVERHRWRNYGRRARMLPVDIGRRCVFPASLRRCGGRRRARP